MFQVSEEIKQKEPRVRRKVTPITGESAGAKVDRENRITTGEIPYLMRE